MGTLAFIGLGSNLGDRRLVLDTAIAGLAESSDVRVRAVSTYHETRPAGGPGGQGTFLNAASALETELDPYQLLSLLRKIEVRAGRERLVRWGRRTLDLDLLLFGDQIIDTADLTVPHPRMAVRRFVLSPLAEVAAELIDPLTRRPIKALLANLDRRPGYVALDLPQSQRRTLFRRLVAALMAAGLSTGNDPIAESVPRWIPPKVRENPMARILDQRTQELRADRWSADLWNERWLVTEFWLDRLFLDLVGPDRLAHLGGNRDSFLELRALTIQPTFVVAPRLAAGQLSSWAEEVDPDRPIGSDIPILRPESDDPDGVLAEILAACAASRP